VLGETPGTDRGTSGMRYQLPYRAGWSGFRLPGPRCGFRLGRISESWCGSHVRDHLDLDPSVAGHCDLDGRPRWKAMLAHASDIGTIELVPLVEIHEVNVGLDDGVEARPGSLEGCLEIVKDRVDLLGHRCIFGAVERQMPAAPDQITMPGCGCVPDVAGVKELANLSGCGGLCAASGACGQHDQV
jgi:hypothetical protein